MLNLLTVALLNSNPEIVLTATIRGDLQHFAIQYKLNYISK